MRNSRIINKAKHPESQKSRPTIGFLTCDMLTDPGLELWAGVADAAREQDVNVLCFLGDELRSPRGFRGQANIIYDLVSEEHIDGLVIWSSPLSNFIGIHTFKIFCEGFHPLPIVSVALSVEGIPSILIDSYQGMHKALEHLVVVHGCRRIAFIRAPEDNLEGEDRYRAYTDVLREYGLLFDPNLVLPGDFQKPSGAIAMRLLLDERKLRPRTDFEAVVAANDAMLIGALEVLQERGIRVPGDVVMVGFDDSTNGKHIMPPLTTAPLLNYEQGQRAVEQLLALLAGEDVTEKVVLSANLVVRESCGCVDPAVVQAAAGWVLKIDKPFEIAFAACREEILIEMMKVMGARRSVDLTSVEQLMDSFTAEIRGKSSNSFLPMLKEILYQVMTAGGDVAVWQNALSVMRCHTLPYLRDSETVSRVEDLWQQARVMTGRVMQQVQAYQAMQAEQRALALREIGTRLISMFDLGELTNVLAEGLPRIGVRGCYLSLYENPQPYNYLQPAPEWSRLILAYNEHGRIMLDPDEQRFLSRQLVPEGMLPQGRACSMIVMSLYFQQHQLGFALFEADLRDKTTYEALRVEISSALQGAFLVQRVQERSAEIARQNYILDTFMENVPDRIYFKDLDGRITRANKAYAIWFGLNDPAQAIGKTDFNFFPKEKAQTKHDQEQEILRTGQPLINVEEVQVWPDGRVDWSLTTKMPLRDENGNIIGTFGVSRDITALKQAEKALRRLEKAVETTEVGITIADNDGYIVYVNPAEAAMHGHTVDELIGQPSNIFAPPKLRKARAHEKDEEKDTLRWKRERINIRKDGSTFPVMLISTPITNTQGHPIGRVTICEDITERKQAEAQLLTVHNQLKEKNVQLAELNASKDKFFSIISHDLRSPLNAILGFSHLLDENIDIYSKDEIKTRVQKLRTSAENLYALLENLLTWSRIQRGVMEYKPEYVDIYKVTAENIELFLSKAFQKHITFRNVVEPETSVYADYQMINTVLRNLLSNALKFTHTGGTIDISAQRHNENYIEIAVSDSGIGINNEDLPKLFRIDVQYTTIGTTGEQGTGLGLNLCKDLVEKNGGTIWVESDMGKGTTFRFTLLKFISENEMPT